ncbi:ParB/RepB/Spo0J family partition protein [Enterovibrio paralichthyis]|uniref:ParB/RepB/Spo0J family partition protein n=1 Tax=Enterovibrio paralichthyis TaxID=2853805 RepID=UPI001C468788|nr:ParB N-terminal domain-containing protein [Enterovibrio paralichthyis]MBV7300215.1 ParB N-terminal domain-containing protein [Enterovibrio paralichthyis]
MMTKNHFDPKFDINVKSCDLLPDPLSPLMHHDEQEIASLVCNVRKAGILHPLSVRPVPGVSGVYYVTQGEILRRAAISEGIECLPVRVVDSMPAQLSRQVLTDNLLRNDLCILSLSETLRHWLKLGDNFTLSDACKVVGGSLEYWQAIYDLFELPADLKRLILRQKLTNLDMIAQLKEIMNIDVNSYNAVMSTLVGERYAGKASDYVKRALKQLKESKVIGHIAPIADENGHFLTSHPSVCHSHWRKADVEITLFTLQLGKQRWAGGYEMNFKGYKINIPLSVDTTARTECQLLKLLHSKIECYLDGLGQRVSIPDFGRLSSSLLDWVEGMSHCEDELQGVSVDGMAREGDFVKIESSGNVLSFHIDDVLKMAALFS